MTGLRLTAVLIAAFAAGHFALPAAWEAYAAVASGGVLAVLIVALLTAGRWSFVAASAALLASSAAAGSCATPHLIDAAVNVYKAAVSVQFLRPRWLLCLLLVPPVLLIARRGLSGLTAGRRRAAVGLRVLLVTLLSLALAEPVLRRPNENVTVLYVVDRSLSVPQDVSGGVDRQWERLGDFLARAPANRRRRDDRSGVILYAGRPRLALPPAAVDRLYVTEQMAAELDADGTDTASALKLALASFPEGTGKRVVLISDGNATAGGLDRQADLARRNGVQIDTILLPGRGPDAGEVLVERVEAPRRVSEETRVDAVQVLLRNTHRRRVVQGRLAVVRTQRGREDVDLRVAPDRRVVAAGPPAAVRLEPGNNLFVFLDQSPPPESAGSFSYRAVFTPEKTIDERTGRAVAGLPGDRGENNRAGTHVVVQGRQRVLLLESDAGGRHAGLVNELRAAGLSVVRLAAGRLPTDAADLNVFLSNFECVVLANVPAEQFTEAQQEALRSRVAEQGCGLVMTGGPDSFGAGGYQNTPVEKALPVDCEIKSLKAASKGGLVLVMHATEMAEGNRWQKRIARLAVEKLAPADMLGVIDYDGFRVRWYVPFQQVAPNRDRLLTLIDRMSPGDMLSFDRALTMAEAELTAPKHNLSTRHMIVISDGDPSLTGVGNAALARMKAARVMCAAVGVACHPGPATDATLKAMAATTGGKFYNVTDPRKLPSIYTREVRRVSQSFLYRKRFTPRVPPGGRVPGVTDGVPAEPPDLFGFVRTTLKPRLAVTNIAGPQVFDQKFPVLATWPYGLGRSAAFTSDASGRTWGRLWPGWPQYRRFWRQLLTWAMPAVDTDALTIRAERLPGRRVRVTVTARDEKSGEPLADLKLDGGLTRPEGGVGGRLKFRQVAAGEYVAEFDADRAGSYFVTAQADAGDKRLRVREGVTVPYSREFADLEPNPDPLRRLSERTNGRFYEATPESLGELIEAGELYRESEAGFRSRQPFWYWLVFLAGVGLLFDVAVRRIAIDPASLSRSSRRLWAYLRQRPSVTGEPDYLAGLRRAKGRGAERIDRRKSRRKFEPTAGAAGAPPGADDAPARPVQASPPPPPPPPEPAADEGDDFMSRMRRAKRRARDERGGEAED